MRRFLGFGLAVAFAVVGVLWTLGGLGIIGRGNGGAEAYAIIGPLLAGLGVALAIVMVQGLRRR